jgi:outer membrane protein OmpA-like peptidoglycan-associated protein
VRYRFIGVLSIALLATLTIAQQGTASAPSGDAFWVSYWTQPRVILYGPEEEVFYQNMKFVMFPWNDHQEPSNESVLDDNARWLKEHPNVNFNIDGHASTRGEDIIYNLALSQRRAEWVKQALISRGIPENRIKFAVGWGQLYAVCLERDDECWTKNRLVRFSFVPTS